MFLMPDHKWARLLAYVTGLVNQKLLLQNEYLAAENRILRMHLPARMRLSDPEQHTLAEIGTKVPTLPSDHDQWALRRVEGNSRPPWLGSSCRTSPRSIERRLRTRRGRHRSRDSANLTGLR